MVCHFILIFKISEPVKKDADLFSLFNRGYKENRETHLGFTEVVNDHQGEIVT